MLVIIFASGKIMREKEISAVVISLLLLTVIFGTNSVADFADVDKIKTDCSFNPYWGNFNKKLSNGTGFFDIIKQDDYWWFITPDGYEFYSVGINVVSPECRYAYNANVLAKYGNYIEWANATLQRFKDWGYNTMGAWSKYDLFTEIPYTHTFIFRHNASNKWKRFVKDHPDVFDHSWQELVKAEVKVVTEQLKNDPYLIGYWLDNEIHWGPDEDDQKTLLENYMSAPYTSPGKQSVAIFLKDRYDGDVDEFNKVWNMNLKSLDELFDQRELGRDGWRIQSKLRIAKLKLFRQEPKLLFNLDLLEKADDDIKEFSRLVAETYFNFITSLIRENDPNHLILGVRFHCAEGTPVEVIEECGKYCDVVSINYYRRNKFIYDPIMLLKSLARGLVPLDQWMKRYYLISGKPLLIGEFTHVSQNDERKRADYFEWYAKSCLNTPYIVGYHWFPYVNGAGSEWGLVDQYDKPYNILVDRMAHINSEIYEIRGIANN